MTTTRYHRRLPSDAASAASDADWDTRSVNEGYRLSHKQFICWGIILGTIIVSGVFGLVAWAVVDRMHDGNRVSVPSNTNLTIVPSPDMVKSFYGLTYTPQRAQYPGCGVSLGDVVEDLKVLSQLTTRVRLYGMDCDQVNLLRQAIELLKIDVSLVLTVWVDKDQDTYNRQLDALWDTLDKYSGKNIIGISVGNEAIFRKDVTPQELAKRMNDVRSKLAGKGLANIPVYTTDLADNFDSTIMQASDAALGNIHPYFASTSIGDAPKWTWDFYQKTIGASSGKPGIISETGWPTNGASKGSAVPSVANLQSYIDNFLCQTQAKNIPCYFFEAFDAAWKTSEEAVEKSWGLLTKDRKLKIRVPRCDGTASSSSGNTANGASTPSTPITAPVTAPVTVPVQQNNNVVRQPVAGTTTT